MASVEARIVALLLNDSDFVNERSLVEAYRRYFDTQISDQEFRVSLGALAKADVIYEIDPDVDILDLATVDHHEMGVLMQIDYDIEIGLNFYTPGSRMPVFISEHKSVLSDACRFAGFERALKHLQSISFESTTWTGIPANFKLDSVRKEDLAILLREADRRLAIEPAGNGWEITQARAYIQSALVLTEAPDPQADLIFANLERASAIAGLTQFFTALVAFFLGTARA